MKNIKRNKHKVHKAKKRIKYSDSLWGLLQSDDKGEIG